MEYNYHTHTKRCHHASGEDREYIESAIRGGVKRLGFSDHAPQIFPGSFYSAFRMRPEVTEEYVRSLLDLRAEYKNDIEIKIGFEVEYYPALFDAFLEHIRPYPIDYLIMGQHFIDNEYDTHTYTGSIQTDEALLKRYVDQTGEAMRTGRITYFAHPDLAPFTGDEAVYRREYGRLIDIAIETDTPLEINCLGIRANRFYPQEAFWRLAGEKKAKACIGNDAHEPASTPDPASEETAQEMIRRFGLIPVEPVLRDPQNPHNL